MAKTIKFNLICDNNPVRTIEDLQNNFSIEDVLAYYNNKLLHRWLDVRGYHNELEKVSAITCEEPMEIIKELIKIFDVVKDEKKVAESIYMLEYLEERKSLCATYEQENYKVKNIIKDYKTGYEQLVEDILENWNDMEKIKTNIAEIVTNYMWVYKLNHRELFYNVVNKSYLTVMCLLMNDKTRKFYLPIEKTDNYGETIRDIDDDRYSDKRAMYKSILAIVANEDFQYVLGGNLISFSGVTDGYWKDLEPKGKKYMILSIGKGDFVRSAGQTGGDLGIEDIENKFVIVDGIDYKSNSATHQLLYMEV